MSDLLGLPCIHGEDATLCETCWSELGAILAAEEAALLHPTDDAEATEQSDETGTADG